jgi:hypothetical protein
MPVQKKYCGLKEPLPQGYTQYADRYTCLRKGVGIGKTLPRQVNNSTRTTTNVNRLYIILMVLLIILNIILMIWIFMLPKHDEKHT